MVFSYYIASQRNLEYKRNFQRYLTCSSGTKPQPAGRSSLPREIYKEEKRSSGSRFCKCDSPCFTMDRQTYYFIGQRFSSPTGHAASKQ